MQQSKNVFLITLILCLIIHSISHAQYAGISYIAKSSELKGDIEFNNQSYVTAIKYYKYALEEDPDNFRALIKLAKSYRLINDNISAEPFYAKSIKEYLFNVDYERDTFPNSTLDSLELDQKNQRSDLSAAEKQKIDSLREMVLFDYIEILASNSKQNEIPSMVAKYKQLPNTQQLIHKRFDSFENIEAFSADSKFYTASNLTNTKGWSDFGPSYYKEGFLFVSNRYKKSIIRSLAKNNRSSYFDIYYTEKEPDGGFKKAVRIKKSKLNTKYHEGPLCVYANNSKIALTRNNIQKNKADRSNNDINSLGIYFADIANNKLEDVTSFAYNSPEYNCVHPTISQDGSLLVFASDMGNSIGHSDLYVCYKTENGWSEPSNLGDIVNTPQRELYPSLHGNTLYFASNGHPGIGGMDVYKTILKENKPTEIVNLGNPINTSKDDFGLITKTGKQGYFVSNRRNELNDVLFSYTYNKPNEGKLITNVFAIDTTRQTIVSIDSTNHSDTLNYRILSNTAINVIDTRENQYLAPIEVKNDTFVFALDTGVVYSVIVAKQQYFTNKVDFQSGSKMTGELTWPVPLDSLQVGKAFELDEIYYDFDKSTLRDSSKYQLNYLIVMLQDNPTMKAEIHAHTDTRGPESYNMRLSKRRAQSVVKYTENAGIREERLIPVGFGESQPLVECEENECTEEQHQLNRRTELLVTEL